MKKSDFSQAVEKIAHEGNLTLLESITVVTERLSINPENVPKLMTKSLFDKLEVEAEQMNYIQNNEKSSGNLNSLFT